MVQNSHERIVTCVIKSMVARRNIWWHILKKHSRPPPIVEQTNVSQNNQNHTSTWKILKVCQKIKRTLKKWRSISWYHEILRNAKCILLYIKMQKHPTWSDTPHYQGEAIKSVPGTWTLLYLKVPKLWSLELENTRGL